MGNGVMKSIFRYRVVEGQLRARCHPILLLATAIVVLGCASPAEELQAELESARAELDALKKELRSTVESKGVEVGKEIKSLLLNFELRLGKDHDEWACLGKNDMGYHYYNRQLVSMSEPSRITIWIKVIGWPEDELAEDIEVGDLPYDAVRIEADCAGEQIRFLKHLEVDTEAGREEVGLGEEDKEWRGIGPDTMFASYYGSACGLWMGARK